MANFELIEVVGIEHSINAMQLPVGKYGDASIMIGKLIATEQQMKRAKALTKQPTNSGHPNFLSGITVYVNITADHSFWLQWMRYHFQQIISSTSKMYTITKTDIKDNCHKFVRMSTILFIESLVKLYMQVPETFDDDIIENLVDLFEGSADVPTNRKELFECIIMNLPIGYQLTASVVTNYLQLRNMYEQRLNHKTSSWSTDFVRFIDILPENWLIKGEND